MSRGRRRGDRGRVGPAYGAAGAGQRARLSGSASVEVLAQPVARVLGAAPAGAVRRGVPDPPYALDNDDGRGRARPAGRPRLAGRRAPCSSWSGRRVAWSPPGPTGLVREREKGYGETVLWYVRADAPRPRRQDDRMTRPMTQERRAPSRVSRLLRPGDQRPHRHHLAGLAALRRGRGRGRRQQVQVQRPAVHRRGADVDAGEGLRGLPQRDRSPASRACSPPSARSAASAPSSRDCARSATSTTSCRWPR